LIVVFRDVWILFDIWIMFKIENGGLHNFEERQIAISTKKSVRQHTSSNYSK